MFASCVAGVHQSQIWVALKASLGTAAVGQRVTARFNQSVRKNNELTRKCQRAVAVDGPVDR